MGPDWIQCVRVFRPSRHCHITPSEKHTQDMTPSRLICGSLTMSHLVRDKIANSEFRTSPPASSIPQFLLQKFKSTMIRVFWHLVGQSISVTQLEELASVQDQKGSHWEWNKFSIALPFPLHSLFFTGSCVCGGLPVSFLFFPYPFVWSSARLSSEDKESILVIFISFCAKTGQALHR